MFADTFTSAGPIGVDKNSPFSLGFQHHPWGPADVNAKKIMFDPNIVLVMGNEILLGKMR